MYDQGTQTFHRKGVIYFQPTGAIVHRRPHHYELKSSALTAFARELHVFPPPLTDDWAIEVFHFAAVSAQARFVRVHLNYDKLYTETDYVESNARCLALLMRAGVKCEIVIKGSSDNN